LIKKIKNILKDYHKRISIQVSVDAATKEIYRKVRGHSFELLLGNINILKSLGIEVSLSYTIHSLNKQDFFRFIRLAENLEIEALHFPILENFGRAYQYNLSIPEEELKDFYEFMVYYSFHGGRVKIYFVEELKNRISNRLRREKCPAALNQVALGPDGYLYPCSELISNKFRISKLEDYHKINRVLTDFRKKFHFGEKILVGPCAKCPIRNLCGGGCRAVDLMKGKDYMGARQDPTICEILTESTYLIIWELANATKKLSIPTDIIYRKRILEMADMYENV